MKKSLLSMSILISSFSWAADIKNEESYLVKKGDTLWGIADYFLEDPWEWKSLWNNNPHISNPDLIYPNDLIHLRLVDGEYFLELEKSVVEKTFSIKPEVKETEINKHLPLVKMDKIIDFNERYVIIDPEKDYDEIVKLKSSNLLSHKGDVVYAAVDDGKIDDVYISYKKTMKKIDDKALYQKTGELKLEKESGDVFSALITKIEDRVRPNDILIKKESIIQLQGIKPSKPLANLNGQVTSSLNKSNSFIKNDVVVLDLGKKDGLEIGNVLAVKEASEIVSHNDKDLTIDGAQKGLVLVYHVKENYAYAVIVENSEIIKDSDVVTSPF